MADLSIVNSVPAHSASGEDMAFDATVTNAGPDAATNVVVSDAIPAGTVFIDAMQTSGPAFSCTLPPYASGTGTITCTRASLDSGAIAKFRFIFHTDPSATPGSTLSDTATVTSDTADPTPADTTSTATSQFFSLPSADVRVSVDGPASARADTDVTYTIHLLNHGPGDATTVSLTDTLPTGMTFGSVTQTSGPTLACNGSAGTVTCTVATLPSGDEAVVKVVAHLAAGAADGMYVDAAMATSDDDPDTTNDAAMTQACVQADLCAVGVCNATAVVCSAADQCHNQGACDPAKGTCGENTPKADGMSCDDGDACTANDTCQGGVCQSGTPSCDAGSDGDAGDDGAATGDAPAEAGGDAPPTPDAGTEVAPTVDAGLDAGGGASDAAPDAPQVDAASHDAKADAKADAKPTSSGGGGCGCRTAGGDGLGPAAALLLLAVIAAARARQPRRRPRA
jgi:uncharacterized repeat protein (TIGR01451 family)/MYXO-CTERM domain-containing protein